MFQVIVTLALMWLLGALAFAIFDAHRSGVRDELAAEAMRRQRARLAGLR